MKNSTALILFRILIVVCGLFSATSHLFAQQDPLYGLWLNNPLVINPAYTGINNNFTAFASYRSQWAGFDGSPMTMTAGAHSSLLRNKMGAGFMIVNDKIGENTNTQVMGTFAYKLPINAGTSLSFGMSGGFMNYKTNASHLTLQDPTDPLFGSISQLKPSIGAGIMLKSDKYLLGFSVPRLLNGSFDNGGQKINVYQQHFYLMGSYLFSLSERLTLKPSVLLKAVSGSPLSADVNVNLILNTNYMVGLYTRNLNAYGLMAQVTFLDKFRFAYALEVPSNSSVGTQFITNEVMISMRTPVLIFHERSVSNF
jgi:type IX secretion system PorP/SprF family membrane protein